MLISSVLPHRAIVVLGLFMALNLLSLFLPISPSAAQKPNASTAELDLFDNLMRSGKLPVAFEVRVYRTAATGLGPRIGTIVVWNTMIKIAGREEAALALKANIIGLTPGPHAFHIHEYPDCGPKMKDGVMVPGLAAGAHLFAEHQVGTDIVTYKSHLGNLPNLLVSPDGTTTEEVIAPRLALADLVNRSIMIHASQDDNSARVACGVFK
ncbi:MAG: superoxide dismutase family protein [Rhodomicrobium sp.]